MPIPRRLIAIVDDDEALCHSLARVLTAHGYRVRVFFRAADYLLECQTMDHSCVLVDIRMPEMDGLAMQQASRELGVAVPAVFMTATGDIPAVVQAMKLGAADLLAKPFDSDTLIATVERALGTYDATRESQRELVRLWRDVSRLTPREAEVCALVTLGLLNKQVAALIHTSEKTVKVHRARVRQKLHSDSLAELVRVVDRLLSDAKRPFVRFDGLDVTRPRTVDMIARMRDRVADRIALPHGGSAPTGATIGQFGDGMMGG
ncbi:MAG TPA: response regulator [Gemmatimonadaceae bacterium]|nr:response regulator [Gemmatimonadaceae bacterium]